MRNVILSAALFCCLMSFSAMEATASVTETLAPAKKTTKKSTKKTTKSTKTTKKTTTTATKAATATSAASTLTEAAEAATTSKSSSSTGSSLLGGLLSAIGGEASSNSGSDIISGLTSIFNSSKVATKDKLVGTWTYTEPAVVFSSSNVLKNIGGKVASSTIENQLESQLEKLGVKKGNLKMTFDKDGNFTQTLGGKTLSGTYTVSGKNVALKYAGSVSQIVGTTQLDGNDLLIVMDATKLLKYAKVLGALTGNSLLSTAGSLFGSMDGMEVGLKLNK
jgi:hypothetical protein